MARTTCVLSILNWNNIKILLWPHSGALKEDRKVEGRGITTMDSHTARHVSPIFQHQMVFVCPTGKCLGVLELCLYQLS